MAHNTPGEIEIVGYFRSHLGPRMEAAGLRIQFHYNQKPGIHFKTPVPEEYRDAILKGIEEAMAVRFPEFPKSGSIWINEILSDDIDSNPFAFYKAGLLVIEQAFALRNFSQARKA